MSIDRTTYVGPYLACQYKGQEPDQFDMYERINNDLHMPLGDTLYFQLKEINTHIYLPNKGLVHCFFIEDNCAVGVYPLSWDYVERALKEFSTRYHQAIKNLKPFYTGIQFDFGVIHQVY